MPLVPIGKLKITTGGFEEDEEKDLEEVALRVAEEALKEESSAGEDIKEFVIPMGWTVLSPLCVSWFTYSETVTFLQGIVYTLIPLSPLQGSGNIIPMDWSPTVLIVDA